APRGDATAGVDAPEDEAEVLVALRLLLPGVTRRDADGPAWNRERRIDPPVDRTAAVVRVTVGAEAHIDGDRLLLPVGEADQVVDRVGEPCRVVERLPAVLILLAERK